MDNFVGVTGQQVDLLVYYSLVGLLQEKARTSLVAS